jgi:hypothetical protein
MNGFTVVPTSKISDGHHIGITDDREFKRTKKKYNMSYFLETLGKEQQNASR